MTHPVPPLSLEIRVGSVVAGKFNDAARLGIGKGFRSPGGAGKLCGHQGE
ncbi:MAG: hypothetical protein ACLQLE_01480 [Desulfobaccales bacterium]